MRSVGFEPPYPEDETHPVPREIFPTGKKTARYGLVVRRAGERNRPLEPIAMEWGFPTKVASKRDPAVKLDKFVTNARNLSSSMWKPSIASPDRRCLVSFTHFAEPHPEGGKGDDGKPRQMWFSLPDQPIAFFAGLWRPTERGDAYAFCTTSPNPAVAPWHPKAMPAILHPRDFTTWLDGSHEDALKLVRPYEGEMSAQEATPDGGSA
ncbi:DUF159 family protein [Sphingomonas sp. ABOLH]|nr:DUF159 family protein [Sphingomonas sp. ABOLH]